MGTFSVIFARWISVANTAYLLSVRIWRRGVAVTCRIASCYQHALQYSQAVLKSEDVSTCWSPRYCLLGGDMLPMLKWRDWSIRIDAHYSNDVLLPANPGHDEAIKMIRCELLRSCGKPSDNRGIYSRDNMHELTSRLPIYLMLDEILSERGNAF